MLSKIVLANWIIPLNMFENSVENRVFQDALKIARVTPLFKGRDSSDISNYRPISVLHFFSKLLERIMYNRFHKYLTADKLY